MSLMPENANSRRSRSRVSRETSFFESFSNVPSVHPVELVEALDARADGLEVREHAAQPALGHVVLRAARRVLGDHELGLLLRAHEQHVPAAAHDLGDRRARVLDALERLLQIDDVDAVPLHEGESLHLRIPSSRLVPEVNTRFEQVLHDDLGHG
jgi:hypothetical protein